MEEVKEALDAGRIPAEIDLLDIREPFEAKIAQIPKSASSCSLAGLQLAACTSSIARAKSGFTCKDGARSTQGVEIAPRCRLSKDQECGRRHRFVERGH